MDAEMRHIVARELPARDFKFEMKGSQILSVQLQWDPALAKNSNLRSALPVFLNYPPD